MVACVLKTPVVALAAVIRATAPPERKARQVKLPLWTSFPSARRFDRNRSRDVGFHYVKHRAVPGDMRDSHALFDEPLRLFHGSERGMQQWFERSNRTAALLTSTCVLPLSFENIFRGIHERRCMA